MNTVGPAITASLVDVKDGVSQCSVDLLRMERAKTSFQNRLGKMKAKAITCVGNLHSNDYVKRIRIRK